MNRRPRLTAVAAGLALVTVPVLAGCGTESTAQSGDASRSLTVSSTDDACDVSAAEAPAGTLTFQIANEGSSTTEFYLLAEDGLRIVGEVENIGTGATNTLTVNAEAGTYVVACKPGMTGDGIRSGFTVTESDEAPEVSETDQQLVDRAVANYGAYVDDQAGQLLEQTQEFVDLYTAGDDDAARALYPVARTHWERIETVAESFGDLDPKMDLREADLEPGQEWTGWHKIEKDLWPDEAVDYTPLTDAERQTYADDLMANTQELFDRVSADDFTVELDQIANGSRGLLEEVAVGKITGEEEIWSHTDLWDFQANVDGARVAFEGVQPIVEDNDPELASELATRFDDLQALLDAQRDGDGFVLYTELTDAEVKELSTAVNALSEPLSRLTAAVV
ncbi:MAG: PbrT family lead (Pb2+) uptake porter [Nocardioides sp.]|nr:PbrT family lead (Pb2+) uptake porter [Nocardioides sp.]